MKVPIKLLLLIFFFNACSKANTQECKVGLPSLQGTYSGECKKGKAHGKGKAEGEDKYDGMFVNGLPDGDGEYVWKNGNSYKGKFSKGQLHGTGELTYRAEGKADSVVKGFWKNNKYYGLREHPYTVWFQSRKLGELEVEHRKSNDNTVTFFITPTYTAPSADENTKIPVGEIQMVKGTHGKVLQNNVHAQKSETVISDLTFPCRMRVMIASEEIEIEFHEPGTYVINLKLHR